MVNYNALYASRLRRLAQLQLKMHDRSCTAGQHSHSCSNIRADNARLAAEALEAGANALAEIAKNLSK